LKSVSKFLML